MIKLACNKPPIDPALVRAEGLMLDQAFAMFRDPATGRTPFHPDSHSDKKAVQGT